MVLVWYELPISLAASERWQQDYFVQVVVFPQFYSRMYSRASLHIGEQHRSCCHIWKSGDFKNKKPFTIVHQKQRNRKSSKYLTCKCSWWQGQFSFHICSSVCSYYLSSLIWQEAIWPKMCLYFLAGQQWNGLQTTIQIKLLTSLIKNDCMYA